MLHTSCAGPTHREPTEDFSLLQRQTRACEWIRRSRADSLTSDGAAAVVSRYPGQGDGGGGRGGDGQPRLVWRD